MRSETKTKHKWLSNNTQTKTHVYALREQCYLNWCIFLQLRSVWYSFDVSSVVLYNYGYVHTAVIVAQFLLFAEEGFFLPSFSHSRLFFFWKHSRGGRVENILNMKLNLQQSSHCVKSTARLTWYLPGLLFVMREEWSNKKCGIKLSIFSFQLF